MGQTPSCHFSPDLVATVHMWKQALLPLIGHFPGRGLFGTAGVLSYAGRWWETIHTGLHAGTEQVRSRCGAFSNGCALEHGATSIA